MEISRFLSDIKRGYYICGDANTHKVYAYSEEKKYTGIRVVSSCILGLALRRVKMVKDIFGAKKICQCLFALYYYLF